MSTERPDLDEAFGIATPPASERPDLDEAFGISAPVSERQDLDEAFGVTAPPASLQVVDTVSAKRKAEAQLRTGINTRRVESSGKGKVSGVEKGLLEKTKDLLNDIGKGIAEVSSTAFKDEGPDIYLPAGVGKGDVGYQNYVNQLIGEKGGIEKAREELNTPYKLRNGDGSSAQEKRVTEFRRKALAKLEEQDAWFAEMGVTDPAERERIFKDRVKETEWTANDTDNTRVLSNGEFAINPTRTYGRYDELVKEITDKAESPEDAAAGIAKLDAMRTNLAEQKSMDAWYGDPDFQEHELAMNEAGVDDKVKILDSYAAKMKDRNGFSKFGDALLTGFTEGGAGIYKTAVGGVAGVSALVGADDMAATLGEHQRVVGSAIADSASSSDLRGQTGVYGVGKDLSATITQMAPMFIGGAQAQALTGLSRVAVGGLSVYGWAAAQGYESKLADAVAMEQSRRLGGTPLTPEEIAEVLGRKETQVAAFLNGAQTAILARVLGAGVERAALGKAANSMTVGDFLTRGGREALKDSTLKAELMAMGKTIFADAKDEFIEEGLNQMFDSIISSAVLDKEFLLGDTVEESIKAGAMGALAGGFVPQAKSVVKVVLQTPEMQVAEELLDGAAPLAPDSVAAAEEVLINDAETTTEEEVPENDAAGEGDVPQGSDESVAPEGSPVAEIPDVQRVATVGRAPAATDTPGVMAAPVSNSNNVETFDTEQEAQANAKGGAGIFGSENYAILKNAEGKYEVHSNQFDDPRTDGKWVAAVQAKEQSQPSAAATDTPGVAARAAAVDVNETPVGDAAPVTVEAKTQTQESPAYAVPPRPPITAPSLPAGSSPEEIAAHDKAYKEYREWDAKYGVTHKPDGTPIPVSPLTEESVRSHRLTTAKQEIERDIADGTIPSTVKSFSELADYVDANEYINDVGREDRQIGPLGKSLGWKSEEFTRFSNDLIGDIDTWLAGGRNETPVRDDAPVTDAETAIPVSGGTPIPAQAETPTPAPEGNGAVASVDTISDIVDKLPIIETENWDDGTVVEWVESPFPKLNRKVELPRGQDSDNAPTDVVVLNNLHGSQTRVTKAGLRKDAESDRKLPLVVQSNGIQYIQDGHHRLTKAKLRGDETTQVRLVKLDDIPLSSPPSAVSNETNQGQLDDTSPVFSREEITVSKPKISRRKRATGTDGESVTEVKSPSVTDPDKWYRLGDTSKLSAMVDARLDFETGKAPSRKEPVWTAKGSKKEVLGQNLTYSDAIEMAKDYVMGANPETRTPEGPESAAPLDPLEALIKQLEEEDAAPTLEENIATSSESGTTDTFSYAQEVAAIAGYLPAPRTRPDGGTTVIPSGPVIHLGGFSQAQVDAIAETVLTPVELSTAARELGEPKWNESAKKKFAERFGDWLSSGVAGSAKLAKLFRKVWKSIMVAGIAGVVAVSPVNDTANVQIVEIDPILQELPDQMRQYAIEGDIKDRILKDDFDPTIPMQERGITAEDDTSTGATPNFVFPDFGGAEHGTNVRLVAQWVLNTGNNGGKPFTIADKNQGQIYFFDASGKLGIKSPALFGSDYGDIFTKEQFNRSLSENRRADDGRITPSGRFETATDSSKSYGKVIPVMSKGGGSRIAIHKTFLGREKTENRAKRLGTETGEDNRVSLGCINIPEATMKEAADLFKQGGVVYILPETPQGKAVFDGFSGLEIDSDTNSTALIKGGLDPVASFILVLAGLSLTRKKAGASRSDVQKAVETEVENSRFSDAKKQEILAKMTDVLERSFAATAAPAPAPAAKTPRRITSRMSRPQELFQNNPVVAAIISKGGIMSKTRARTEMGPEWWEQNKSLYDDAPVFRNPTFNTIYSRTGTLTPDKLAQALASEGIIADDVNALWVELNKAADSASRINRQSNDEDERMDQMEKQTIAFEKGIADTSNTPVEAWKLEVGDEVVVDGEPMEVTDIEFDDRSNPEIITLKDGSKFGVQIVGANQVIYVESLKKNPANYDEGEPNIDFGLDTQTDAQIKEEAAAAKRKAEIEERRNRKLTGSTGDLTADMFGGGETPLFNENRSDTSMPHSVEAIKTAFGVDDDVAVATDALAQAMGINLEGVKYVRGGKPGSGALSQADDAAYLELAKDPEANAEQLQRMVNEAAGYKSATEAESKNTAKAIIQKGEEIEAENDFLNCEFFCNKMVGSKGFKAEFSKEDVEIDNVEDAISKLKSGDVIAFDGVEGNPARHYAVYISDGKVYEVEQWGAKPRVDSIEKNLQEYEVISQIFREKPASGIEQEGGGAAISTPSSPSGGVLKLWHRGKEALTKFDPSRRTLLSPFGFHFGTKEQATFRGTQYDYVGSKSEFLKPFFVTIRKPFRTNHMGSSSNDWLVEVMIEQELIEDAEYEALLEETGFDDIKTADGLVKILKENGYDGIVYSNEKEGDGDSYVPFDPNQIKSADPVTRDENGDVIPLSRRFDSSSDNTLYQNDESNSRYTDIPSDETLAEWISSDKTEFIGSARSIPEGTPVGLRIDIPTYNRSKAAGTPVYAVTVHEKANGRVGRRIGYDGIARVSNPVFFTVEKAAAAIRDGKAKSPIATVEGEFNPSREIPEDINEWTATGFNPRNEDGEAGHSFFYDKRTRRPVVSGSEAISVGNTVFVKNPVFGESRNFLYQQQESADTARFNELTKDLDTKDIEGWKARNPEKLKELTEMRERILRDAGYETKAYHVTNYKFDTFDPNMAAMGGAFWFTETRAKIANNETGAGLRPDKEKIILDVYLKANKQAGWGEYDKLGLGEIEGRGFDSVKLDDDYIIFNSTQIKSADPLATDADGNLITPDQWGDTGNPSILYQESEITPFFSNLARTVEAKIPNRATPEQIMGTIRSAGVKAEEVKWSGIEQALPGLAVDGKVPKEALMAYLAAEGSVTFDEVSLGSYPADIQKLYDTLEAENQGRDFDDWDEGSQEKWMSERGEPRQTKFGEYVLPGGENYREVVLAMPLVTPIVSLPDGATVVKEDDGRWRHRGPAGNILLRADSEVEARREAAAIYSPRTTPSAPKSYTSSHFPDVPNYVAHMRTNERDNGLFIEEIQSDRHQEGRKKGYKGDRSFPAEWALVDSQGDILATASTEEDLEDPKTSAEENGYIGLKVIQKTTSRIDPGVPDAPFRTSWPLAMFKRALRDAVESGKDWIGWTVGETQNDRFDLSKTVEEIEVVSVDAKGESPLYEISVTLKNGNRESLRELTESKMEETIGKDLTKKIVEDQRAVQEVDARLYSEARSSSYSKARMTALEKEKAAIPRSYSGLDLQVGGSGMKGFYDNMLPKEIGKYVKQWGGKVEQSQISTSRSQKDDTTKAFTINGTTIYDPYSDESGYPISDPATYWASEGVPKADIEKALGASASTPIWRIDITPQMRESILNEGQPLFQKGKKIAGSVEFLADGTALIRGFKAADESTGIHELTHVARRQLFNRSVPEAQREGITDDDITTVEEFAGAKNGVWTEEAEERFARANERYLRDGIAPSQVLAPVFAKMSAWLHKIYATVKGSPIDIEITPAMRAVLDKLYTRGDVTQAVADAPVEPLVPEVKVEFVDTFTPEPPSPAADPAAFKPNFTMPPPPASSPQETAPEPTEPGRASHEMSDAERATFGLPPRIPQPAVADTEQWQKAQSTEDAHRAAGNVNSAGTDLMLSKLAETDFTLTADEQALIIHEIVARRNVLTAAQNAVARLPKNATEQAKALANDAVTAATEQYNQVLDFNDAAGSEEGRAFRLRRWIMALDFTQEGLSRRMRVAKNRYETGNELTPAEIATAAKYAEDLKAAQEKLEDLTGENAEQARIIEQLTADIEKAKKETPKPVSAKVRKAVTSRAEAAKARLKEKGITFLAQAQDMDAQTLKDFSAVAAEWLLGKPLTLAEFTQKLVSTFGTWIADHAERIHGGATQVFNETSATVTGKQAPSPEQIVDSLDAELDEPTRKDVWDIARAHVLAGTKGAPAVLDAAHESLSTVYPDLTRERVAELFTDYGKITYPSNDEASTELGKVKNLERIALKIADLKAGRAPKRTGFQRDPEAIDLEVRRQEREFRRLYKELVESGAITDDSAGNRSKSALAAAKTRMRNAIEELEAALAPGGKAIPSTKSTLVLDAEAVTLKTRLEALRNEYNEAFEKEGLTVAQRQALVLRSLDRQIAEETDMLKNGILKKGKAVPVEDTPEIAEARRILAEKRQIRRDLYEAEHPLEQVKAATARSIEALRSVLEKGVVDVQEKNQIVPDAELSAMLDVKEALADEVAEMRRESERYKTKQIENALRSAEAALGRIERKLASGDLSIPAKTPSAASRNAAVVAVRARVKELNRDLDARRREAKVGPYSDEARLHRQLATLKNRKTELERRIREKDISKKAKPLPIDDPQIRRAEFEIAKLKADFNEIVNKIALKDAPLTKKVAYYGIGVANLLKVVTLGLDVGVIFRQLGTSYQMLVNDTKTILTGRTKQDGSQFLRMLRTGVAAFKDPKVENAVYEKIMTRPGAVYDKVGSKKMYFSPPFDSFDSSKDDIPRADLLAKIPPWMWPALAGLKWYVFGMSPPAGLALMAIGAATPYLLVRLDRAQRTMTNASRAEFIDAARRGASADGAIALTPADYSVLNNAVMVGTGRGHAGKSMDSAMPVSNLLLLATRYYLSRIQALSMQPLWNFTGGDAKASAAARGEVAKMYAKSVTGRAAIYGVIALLLGRAFWDDDDDDNLGMVWNPFSPDFMRYRATDKLKIDVTSGTQGFASIVARYIGRQRYDASKDRYTSLGSDYRNNVNDEVMNFLSGKRNLLFSFIVNTNAGQYFGGKPVTAANALEQATTAIIMNDVLRIFEEMREEYGPVEGSAKAAAICTLMFGGIGTSIRPSLDEERMLDQQKKDYRRSERLRERELNR